MSSVKDHVLLPNGCKMPIVGLGTWDLEGDELRNAVEVALVAGYRHFDTAFIHVNEAIIGTVIRDWLESKRIKRKELFITSKLPPTGMTPEKVKHFCQLSLKNLGLSYLDLYLLQLPVGIRYADDDEILVYNPDGTLAIDCSVDFIKTWIEMEKLVDEGLVNSIGICNFNPTQIEKLLESCMIKPTNLQIELHAYFQQKELRVLCREHGITVTAFCPLGSPGRDKMLVCSGNNASLRLLQDPVVTAIAEKCDKTPAQILLRHAIQKNIAVIPKSSDAERIHGNFDVFNFFLVPSEMHLLDDLDKGQLGRSFDYSFFGEAFRGHHDFPFEVQPDESAAPHH